MAKSPEKTKSEDQEREDEILRRMLNTLPKAHKPKESRATEWRELAA